MAENLLCLYWMHTKNKKGKHQKATFCHLLIYYTSSSLFFICMCCLFEIYFYLMLCAIEVWYARFKIVWKPMMFWYVNEKVWWTNEMNCHQNWMLQYGLWVWKGHFLFNTLMSNICINASHIFFHFCNEQNFIQNCLTFNCSMIRYGLFSHTV